MEAEKQGGLQDALLALLQVLYLHMCSEAPPLPGYAPATAGATTPPPLRAASPPLAHARPGCPCQGARRQGWPDSGEPVPRGQAWVPHPQGARRRGCRSRVRACLGYPRQGRQRQGCPCRVRACLGCQRQGCPCPVRACLGAKGRGAKGRGAPCRVRVCLGCQTQGSARLAAECSVFAGPLPSSGQCSPALAPPPPAPRAQHSVLASPVPLSAQYSPAHCRRVRNAGRHWRPHPPAPRTKHSVLAGPVPPIVQRVPQGAIRLKPIASPRRCPLSSQYLPGPLSSSTQYYARTTPVCPAFAPRSSREDTGL